MDRKHGYCILAAKDLPGELEESLATRPTFGLGLSGQALDACSLGGLDQVGGDLLDTVRKVDIPPRGSRIVLGRVDVATLVAASWLDLRATGHEQPGRGRMHDLAHCLRRAPDLCARLRGDDLSLFEDGDATMVRAAVCRAAHDARLPLRCRIDLIGAHLQSGTFPGQGRVIERIRFRPGQHRRSVVRHAARTRQSVPTEPTAGVGPPADPPATRPGTSIVVPVCRVDAGQLRTDITADANLYGAWERVRDNARERSSWSKSLAAFEKDLGSNLSRIAADLRDGSWSPSVPAHVTMPKSDGRTRHLHIPPVADRVVERAITQVLSALVDPHLSPWSFAFRPGRGVRDAVRELAVRRDDGATHVARFDIVDCFGSLDHRRLHDALRRYLDDPWLIDLVDRLVARDLPGLPRHEKLVGIAQGSPLSPLLANLLLEDFDQALYDAGFAPLRYADDVAVATCGEQQARSVLQVAADRAADLGLRINPAKTAVASFDEVVEFLGERIGPDRPLADDGQEAPLPAKRTLYLTARCAHVHLRRGHVRALTRDQEELASVPLSGLGRIVAMGPVSVSAGLRSYAFEHDLEVLFLSRNGAWLGRYDGGCEVEPQLRRRQYRLLDDPDEMVRIGCRMAAGKIANQRALLLRYARRNDGTTDAEAIQALATHANDVTLATSRSQVMGYEGAATKRYHEALRGLFPTEAGFRRRTKQPPRDPANAALSFGYTLLTGEAHAACASVGLDPQVGVLHASGRNRAALAFDLVEEFRPLIVDSIALAAFRRGRLPKACFRKGAHGAVLLNDRGRRVFINLYETRMLSRYRSALSGVRHSYRAGMREQAHHLAEVIAGRTPVYRPVAWR